MNDKKKILKFKPINRDAAKFLKPLVDDGLTEEEKKHRVAAKSIEINCPKNLRALYQYNEVLIKFCKCIIDENDPNIKKLSKSPFPETQRVLSNCREIRINGKINKVDLTRFFYGNKNPEVIPFDHNFFRKLVNSNPKQKSKQKRSRHNGKPKLTKKTASVSDILGKK